MSSQDAYLDSIARLKARIAAAQGGSVKPAASSAAAPRVQAQPPSDPYGDSFGAPYDAMEADPYAGLSSDPYANAPSDPYADAPAPDRAAPGAAGFAGGQASGLDARSLLEGLNPAQAEAVVHEGGPLLVIAGAGSGKTRVLTSRIAYLIATGKASPGEILAITFTNKAAKEMRERLDSMLCGRARHMWISTFHSACVRILREQHEAVGMRSTFTIYDTADQERLMKMVCESERIDTRQLTPKKLCHRISDLKNELVTPAMAAETAADQNAEIVARAYAGYQARLAEANAVDFDDLIMRTVQLLQANPQIRDFYRNRFRHILVDEYQDTNHAQYVLVRELTGRPGDAAVSCLTVVGDADQSIYAFRGATIRNIEEFEKDFPNAHSVLLEQNYRSTQNILSAANAVIANNEGRRAKNLWTDQGAGDKLVGYVADAEADEASWVVSRIDTLREKEKIAYKDVAIFYRTNSQSRALEEMLVRSGMPYKIVGGTKFYERREIKDAMAYLHAIANPDDTVSVRRVINMPRRGLGEKAEAVLLERSARLRISYGAALEDVAHPELHPERGPVEGLTPRARSAMEGFVALLESARAKAEAGESPAEILDAVMEESGYLAMLRESKDPQDEVRLDNLAELHSVAADFRVANPEGSLSDWLAEISLVADSDQLPDETDSEGEVTLMTIHTAKGLEFPVVFVTGMEDGIFPHMRSLSSPEELNEERRLAYVALTRARKILHVSRAAVRSVWGATQQFPPSRFLAEIPEELIEWEREEASTSSLFDEDDFAGGWSGRGFGSGGGRSGYGSGRGGSGYGGSKYAGSKYAGRRSGSDSFEDDDFAPAFGSGTGRGAKRSAGGFKPGKLGGPSRKKKAATPAPAGSAPAAATDTGGLKKGDRVRHKSFGTGTILGFEGHGSSTVAQVRFGSGQTKRLMLRYAPLEKI